MNYVIQYISLFNSPQYQMGNMHVCYVHVILHVHVCTVYIQVM